MAKALESKRGRARVCAMQFLYQCDMKKEEAEPELLQQHMTREKIIDEEAGYTSRLVEGVAAHSVKLDEIIQSHLHNWKLSRLSGVDRAILRLGVYELLYQGDVPPKVTLNEMVEMAKRYGSSDSSGFANGVLDAVHHAMNQDQAES